MSEKEVQSELDDPSNELSESDSSPSGAECDEGDDLKDASDLRTTQAADVEALRATRKESREVLTGRIQLLNDIDDKAMRTVRTAVLLVGLVVSVVKLSDPVSTVGPGTWTFRFAVGGVSFLVFSIFAGMITYSVSSVDFGVSDGHRNDVVAGGYSEREWLLFLLSEYDEWTSEMRRTTTKNSVGLHVTLFALVAGLVSLLLSIVGLLKIDLLSVAAPAAGVLVLCLAVTVVLWVATE